MKIFAQAKDFSCGFAFMFVEGVDDSYSKYIYRGISLVTEIDASFLVRNESN